MSLVAIIGRPNVGKSTLFNRLVGMRKAIVDNISGVTRDRHYGRCEWCGAVHGQPHPVTGSLVVLTSRASAEAEALRLQKAVPDGQFVVFESTHVTTTIAGPTHMTLSGQALGQQRFAVLCAVDDEVPF